MGIKAIIGTRLDAFSLKRATSTNPFERNSFHGKSFTGNALPFADVFQAINPIQPKTNKMKMISSAVIGAVSDFKTKVTQPIVNFANSVKECVSNGVDSFKAMGVTIAEMGKNMQTKVANIFNFNKMANETYNGMKILNMEQINPQASVQDLKNTWIAENAMSCKTDNIEKAVTL